MLKRLAAPASEPFPQIARTLSDAEVLIDAGRVIAQTERLRRCRKVVFVDDPGELYTRALRTMREVADSLRDLPDPDGALTRLIERIEGERAWVAAELRLGLPPQQPPRWLVPVGK